MNKESAMTPSPNSVATEQETPIWDAFIADQAGVACSPEHAHSLRDFMIAVSDQGRALETALRAARSELETERMRLAACGVASTQNTPESIKERLTRDHTYWSSSYASVCDAVDREMALRPELAQRDERIKVLENALRLETKNELAGI